MLAILLTCVEFTKQILSSRSHSDLIILGILNVNNDSRLKKQKKIFHYHINSITPLTNPI